MDFPQMIENTTRKHSHKKWKYPTVILVICVIKILRIDEKLLNC